MHLDTLHLFNSILRHKLDIYILTEFFYDSNYETQSLIKPY